MKLPRDLAGRALVAALCRHYEYRIVHQVGSHIVLETNAPTHQRLSIPDHAALRIGTLQAILRMIERHKGVSRKEIVERL